MSWIKDIFDIDESSFPPTDPPSQASEAYLLAWGNHVFKPPTLPRFAGQPGSEAYCPRDLWWEYEFEEQIEQIASDGDHNGDDDDEEEDEEEDEERDRPRRSLIVVLRVAVPQQMKKTKSHAGVRKNRKQRTPRPAASLRALEDDERLARELHSTMNGLRPRLRR
ncbi:Hypothetical protein R9X50_00351400 [Acrodontium crateriforme]|uniref:Uncharacterized protein n=1 Tax=Acrodontium crateriforme TaxID=150365 RepID=A0AAQ3M3I9_9PEZI|nr:Hypothetical protein R9X50_00351400 [Acrodontium crateriforme]